MTHPADSRPGVIVAVCTFRRNRQLVELVRQIDGLRDESPADRIVVIDDSPEGAAAVAVERLHGLVETPILYVHLGSSDIARARNRALDTAAELGAFVVCVDDDCLPRPGWLRELLLVQDACDADIVVGHREFTAPPDAPFWLHSEPFLDENAIYEDRSVPRLGNTANLLARTSWLAESKIRFREEHGTVGGEDMVFFADARAARANIRFAAHSTVDEPCDGHRASYRYQLWRQFWLGNNEALIGATTRETSRFRLLARGARRAATGALRPFPLLAKGAPPQWRWSIAVSARGVGLILGVLGVRVRHRT